MLEFVRMPYEFRNVDQTYHTFMDNVIKDMEFVFVYMNDTLVIREIFGLRNKR